MEHDDVVTMFHEFGHLMHHVLGGHQRWITQSGVATEWDFVEAPSQMFEEWAWSYDDARAVRAAPRDRRGDPEGARRQDAHGRQVRPRHATVQQIFYAAISLALPPRRSRRSSISSRRCSACRSSTRRSRTSPGTKFHTSFGHLVGYSAMYYTYQWSLVIAKDLLTPFESERPDGDRRDARVSRQGPRARRHRDAAELVRDFLGRDYDFEAFERYLVS